MPETHINRCGRIKACILALGPVRGSQKKLSTAELSTPRVSASLNSRSGEQGKRIWKVASCHTWVKAAHEASGADCLPDATFADRTDGLRMEEESEGVYAYTWLGCNEEALYS